MRRSDFRQFEEVVLLAIGKFERSTGLDESSEATIQALGEWPVQAVLQFLRMVGHPIVDLYAASDGSRVDGTGMILWLPKTAYVAGMATRPEVRGRGVASGVLAHLKAEALKRRRAWLALDVESENETAIRVYRKAGYREVAEFAWFTRNGAPEAEGASLPDTRQLARSEQRRLTSELDAGRPEPYRRAFPSEPRALGHNEYILRGPRAVTRTWLRRPENGGLCVLRAYFLTGSRLGALFPMAGAGPEPPAATVASLIGAAGEWLRTLDTLRCLAAIPEPTGAAGSALESAGFSRVVSSKTMVCPSSP